MSSDSMAWMRERWTNRGASSRGLPSMALITMRRVCATTSPGRPPSDERSFAPADARVSDLRVSCIFRLASESLADGTHAQPFPTIRVTAPNSTLDDDPPPLNQPADLGFGSVVAQAVRGRFLNRDGKPNSKKYGLGAQRLARFYLASLDASWTVFFLWMMGILLLLNGCFALAYVSLGDGALKGTEEMGLSDPFLQAFTY